MNILVTGGAGFIGSHIVETLVKKGHKVRVVDDFSTGRQQNLDHLKSVEVIRGDLADSSVARRAVKTMEIVLHHAAVSSEIKALANPMKTSRGNLDATLSLLLACREARVRRVIYAGSASAYGDDATLPKLETMPANPASFYALQKFTGEQYCRLFTSLYGLETVVLRYFNVYGPRQCSEPPYAPVIPAFVRAALFKETVVVDGDGSQTRDFIYVTDAVQANIKAMTAENVSGEIINIGSGKSVSVLSLIESLKSILGTAFEMQFSESRLGCIPHSVASIDKAAQKLGYEPRVSFEEGLLATVEWYRSQLIRRQSSYAAVNLP